MMSVIPIPAFSDNYIWLLLQDNSTEVAVVDPGDAHPVIDYLEREGLRLSTVLVTHHHHDHTGGLAELAKRYSPRIIGPENPQIKEIDERVGEGDSCRVLGRRFEVMAVPGHTLDHIAFFAAGTPSLLFCGDTLFCGGCGRLFEGSPEQMYRSLTRLAKLPEETMVFAAHEYTLANLRFAQAADPDNAARDRHLLECQRARESNRATLPTTIARERQINPFLRVEDKRVQATAATQGESDTPLATFTTLRAWKDNF
ncbi:hydroxyacylglutathione hydrolase [Halomonas sp. McH1-25]|uniref:hydroxyacylglutathione hydrolase n=1 Tax=unclassified Halomonas TaxID=2609666 RepID=UPI001EF3E483|nr:MULTISPECIES: hydroxyacylglutathione hydrolase [unclassified Halomonas]MCG7598336.1 hydroxyacylglutathione hydrolase [Halomonas sp. McH1-25]MCP1340882.1 hydroxyacylglutathione hydrolase [Halomonas sp. FL8]MCP1361604.1 hydroxyacylglutathione hydrolase [Halomonas sp. BBD45]MCP1364862.1 hydroxyacylglutathione hydrolase [Halomonas sp. BBD48]